MFTVKSKNFLKELRRRRRAFGARISGRITVPPELSWWYYQEFGTATLSELHPSKRWYRIDPVNAKVLSWPDPNEPGGRTFREFTFHPGVRPRAIVRQVLSQIRNGAAQDLEASMLSGGFRPEIVKQRLLDKTMVEALKAIVRSMAVELPGTRPDGGKLEGQSAADVFESGAQIVDTSQA